MIIVPVGKLSIPGSDIIKEPFRADAIAGLYAKLTTDTFTRGLIVVEHAKRISCTKAKSAGCAKGRIFFLCK